MQHAQTRSPTRRFARIIVATAVVTAGSLTIAHTLTAQDGSRPHSCSNRTLRGEYGLVFSGTLLEQPTVGTAVRSYDGRGHFTQIDNEHSVFGTVTDRPGEGTYKVNADCTGTMTLMVPDGAIVSSFVIVGDAYQVNEAVMSPAPAFVTAVHTRIR